MLLRILEPKDHFYAKSCTCTARRTQSGCLIQKSAVPYTPGFCGLLHLCIKDASHGTCAFAKKHPAYCRAYGYLYVGLFKIGDFHDYFMPALSLCFSEYIVDMALHSVFGYRKLTRYLRIAEPSVQKQQYFPFSSGELIPL